MSSSNQDSKEFVLPITIDEYFRSYNFDELKKYLDITEKYLEKAKSDFETYLDEQKKELSAKHLSPKELDEIWEFYSDEYWRYSERFPRILRNSFLVSAISLLEYEMDVICKGLKKEKHILISLNDLRGDTLDQFKLYCRLAGLDLPFNGRLWEKINHYYKVRNCIVHTNGLIMELQYKDRKDLIPYLKRNGIISLDTIKQEIALTKSFCEEVIDTVQIFLVELEKSIYFKSK